MGFDISLLFEGVFSFRPLLGGFNLFVALPGFAPAGEALLFWQKDLKPLTPHPAHQIGGTQPQGGRANSLRSDKARQLIRASAQRAGWQASDPGRRTYQGSTRKTEKPYIRYDPF